MHPYYTDINHKIISDDLRAQLISLGLQMAEAIKNDTAGVRRRSYWDAIGVSSTTSYAKFNDILRSFPEVARIEKAFKVSYTLSSLIYVPPAVTPLPNNGVHIDNNRGCGLLFPLWPADETYAPLNFLRDGKSGVIVDSRGYGGGMPFIFDAQRWHGIGNYNHDRFNFQMHFQDSYSEIIQAITTGNFIDKAALSVS